jgi:hypothetical protein
VGHLQTGEMQRARRRQPMRVRRGQHYDRIPPKTPETVVVRLITQRRPAPGRRAPRERSTRGLAPPYPPCMAPVAPLFHPLPSYADAAGSSLHQRGEPAPRVWAISGPLDPVTSGSPRSSPDTSPRRSACIEVWIVQIPKLTVRTSQLSRSLASNVHGTHPVW